MNAKINSIQVNHTYGSNTVVVHRNHKHRLYDRLTDASMARLDRLQNRAADIHYSLFPSGPVIGLYFDLATIRFGIRNVIGITPWGGLLFKDA